MELIVKLSSFGTQTPLCNKWDHEGVWEAYDNKDDSVIDHWLATLKLNDNPPQISSNANISSLQSCTLQYKWVQTHIVNRVLMVRVFIL